MIQHDRVADALPGGAVSIVVPVYSGEEYLAQLVTAVAEVREAWAARGLPVRIDELILVDDSARDGSPAIIDALSRASSWVTALHLSRNFGQHSATVAGILHSSGDWIVTIDEDLQHPPGKILELFEEALRQQADIVYARPSAAVHQSKLRDWSSSVIKRFMEWVTGNPRIRDVNSFRLMRGDVARSSASVAMHDTFFDISLSWFTQRIAVVSMVLRDERFIRTGRSGYGLGTLINHAWRMIFSGDVRILRATTVFGLVTVLLTAVSATALALVKILWPESFGVRGWPSLMVAICFFGGVIVFMQGVALQYLSTLVLRAHGKPSFFVIDRSRDGALLNELDDPER